MKEPLGASMTMGTEVHRDYKEQRPSRVDCQIKIITLKPGDLSLIPRIDVKWMDRADFTKLPSDFNTHTHKKNKTKKKNFLFLCS